MPTTTNYSNRSLDLSIFPLKKTEKPSSLGLRPTVLVITGKLKASQNYIKALLSNIGERKEDESFGSTLMSDIKSSNISFPIQIQQSFSSQNLFVLRWIKKQYNETTPLDERIKKAELINYSIQPGGKVFLDIKLYTEAGEVADIHLPVTWNKE
jgi:hypothetical protein